MVETSEWSDQEFRITVIDMLKALLEKKMDNMQDHMSIISREMETLRKNQKEMMEIKSTITEMKNAFDELISKLSMDKQGTSELKDMPIETSQNWNAKRKKGT